MDPLIRTGWCSSIFNGVLPCVFSSFPPPRLGTRTYLALFFSVSVQLYLVVANEMTKGDLSVILAVGFREK